MANERLFWVSVLILPVLCLQVLGIAGKISTASFLNVLYIHCASTGDNSIAVTKTIPHYKNLLIDVLKNNSDFSFPYVNVFIKSSKSKYLSALLE